jgi:hypothetical protein
MKINMQNYESYCLLYIDNELSAADRMELELFMQAHPTLANELAALQQTVLTPETLLFEDKAILYRYDEMEASLPSSFKQSLYRQETKVVEGFFTNQRMIGIASIAAILLLLLGYKIYFTNQVIHKNEIVQNDNHQIINKKNIDSVSVKTSIDIENKPLTKYKSEMAVGVSNKLFINEKLPLQKEPNFIQQETKTIDATITTPTINLKPIETETNISAIAENSSPNRTENTNANLNNTDNQIEEEENYNKINTDEHDRTIYIANFEIDGDKLRGISRRFNALFKRNKNEKQK